MKRYLKITSYAIFNVEFLQDVDLTRLESGGYKWIIDTYEGKWFNTKLKEWEDIRIL